MSPSLGPHRAETNIIPIQSEPRKSYFSNGRSSPNIIESRPFLGQSGWYLRFTCQSQRTHQALEKHRCLMDDYITSSGRIVPISSNMRKIASKASLLTMIRKWLTSTLRNSIQNARAWLSKSKN